MLSVVVIVECCGCCWVLWLLLSVVVIVECCGYCWVLWLLLSAVVIVECCGCCWVLWLLLSVVVIVECCGYCWVLWLLLSVVVVVECCGWCFQITEVFMLMLTSDHLALYRGNRQLASWRCFQPINSRTKSHLSKAKNHHQLNSWQLLTSVTMSSDFWIIHNFLFRDTHILHLTRHKIPNPFWTTSWAKQEVSSFTLSRAV